MPEEARQTPEQPQGVSPAEHKEGNLSARHGSPPTAEGNHVAELESLRTELAEEKAKADDYLKNWQRSQADFINYKRRMEQERADQAKFANSALILRILPVLDDFGRAFTSIPQALKQYTWLEGIALIDRKLRLVLEQEGVTPIEAVGEDFDPMLHEAVIIEEGTDPQHGRVVEELQKGYKLHDRVIRPTLVKVGQLPAVQQDSYDQPAEPEK
ncbi:MAG: nucleotide exchange factor GrpE [Chloroflexi bacterium]|nr:nucleotide exchange factor GrpE [Chloroflexota bacterium]